MKNLLSEEVRVASVSRRELFRNAAAAACGTGLLGPWTQVICANPLGLPIGSQTYPHRQRIKGGDFAGLCKDMYALGIREVELCSPGYAEFAGLSDGKQTRRILDDHGLTCPSAHFSMKELRTKQSEMIAWAKDIGMTQMGTATLGGPVRSGTVTMDEVKRAADDYNKIGEEAAKAGVQQFLHDEGFEMSKVDGRLTYEVLLELLDPKAVKMQFQMSATPVVGDPVSYFNKYPGRFISMHLQGVNRNPPSTGRAPGIAVGSDGLDWTRIFDAAKTGGLKNYFIEQNWKLTVESVAYLKTLKA